MTKENNAQNQTNESCCSQMKQKQKKKKCCQTMKGCCVETE